MQDILDKLSQLKARDRKHSVFGSSSHRYSLNAPLSEHEVRRIEEKYRFTLPDEYRWFITSVGNGGAGPFYGLFPLGMNDSGDEMTPWDEGGLLGEPGLPFQHSEAWNSTPDFWAGEPKPAEGISEEEEDQLWAAWDKRLEAEYWSPKVMHGAIPICHEGCALRLWLVVTGPLAGNVWRDMRADDDGIAPLQNSDGTPMRFSDWYLHWLDTSLRELASAKPWWRLW